MRSLIGSGILLLLIMGCQPEKGVELATVQSLSDRHTFAPEHLWLSHEHILVDFIGADRIQPTAWNKDSIVQQVSPFLREVSDYGVRYFVDATPNYLGRDVKVLQMMEDITGLTILTNTGLYGARNNEFIPDYAFNMDAQGLATMWIDEYENGIEGLQIFPGFIKIGIDANNPLIPMHEKLVKAAALTHLKTGLTIASHTGKASGLWPQLEILKEAGVPYTSFIWVHAQAEENNTHYLRAAKMGCWISFDGLGWEIEDHIEKLVYAKENDILDHVLISHDAGWFDPQKNQQEITPYTSIFSDVLPRLKDVGFTDEECSLLMTRNPFNAYAIGSQQ